MRISRRTGVFLLLSAILASMFMQYPMFKVHSGNWDNYFILFMSKTITQKGYAPWIANWASYFGLHRTAYPQGTPFLISSFQQISGWNSEYLILVYSYMISTMATIMAFLIALLLRKRDYLFAFFLAFLFSTAPSYVYVTEWTASARGLFMSMLPFFVILNLMLLKKESARKKTVVFLNVLIFVLMFSLHRLSFFMLATLVPAFIISYFLFGGDKHSSRLEKIWSRSETRRKVTALITVIFLIYFVYIFYSQHNMITAVSDAYSSSKILSGYSPIVRLLNIGFSVIASAGILSVLILVPLKEKNINRNMMNTEMTYLMTILIFLAFIILFPMYFRPYASLFISIFIALALVYSLYSGEIRFIKKDIKIGKKAIAVMLAASMSFSIVLQAEWDGVLFRGGKQWMDYREEDVVNSISIIPGNNVFIGGGALRRTSSLNTEKLSIPPGGYRNDLCFYLFAERPDLMSVDDLNLRFSPQISWGGEVYFYSENINVSDSVDVLYHLKYYNYFETEKGGSSNGVFSDKNITNYNYLIYSNGDYSIYLVDGANPMVYKTRLYFAKP